MDSFRDRKEILGVRAGVYCGNTPVLSPVSAVALHQCVPENPLLLCFLLREQGTQGKDEKVDGVPTEFRR